MYIYTHVRKEFVLFNIKESEEWGITMVQLINKRKYVCDAFMGETKKKK